MHWSQNSEYVLKRLFQSKEYKAWADAVQNAGIRDFSENLDELLERLAGLLCTEFEVDLKNKEKIQKIMELAAIAGKTL